MISDNSQLAINNRETFLERLPENILESSLSDNTKLVLATLDYYAARDKNQNKPYSCFISNAELAQNCGITSAGVVCIVSNLVKFGLIQREKGKRHNASVYTLNPTAIAEFKRTVKVSKNPEVSEILEVSKSSLEVSKNLEVSNTTYLNAKQLTLTDIQQEINELRQRLNMLEAVMVSLEVSKNPEVSKGLLTTDTDIDPETCKKNIDHNNTLTESTLQGVMVPVSVVSENLTLQNGEITTAENIIISDSPIEKRNDTTPHGENPNDDNNIDSISNEMDLQGCDTAHNESNPNDDDKTDTTDANPNDMTTTTTQGHSDPTVKRWISIISVLQTDWSQGDDTRRNEILNEVTDIAKQARAIRNEISDDVWCNLNDEMRKLKTLMTDTANTQSKSEGYINN